MQFQRLLRTLAPFALIAAAASAQTGVIDQVSPYTNAGFNASSSSLTWQIEVQAGLAGQLEGFELYLNGSQGSTIDVRVRMGGGWSTNPVVFSTTVVDQTGGFNEVAWVDTTSAAIPLTPGTLFVIELQGHDDGGGVTGSYVAPPGTPLYAQPLFLNGPGCFAGCGWRIAFTTYVVQGSSVTPMCFGTGCPCGNDEPSAGCENSTGNGGLLVQSGGTPSVSADDLGLFASQLPLNQSGLFFMGNAPISVPFGDARRCVGGQTWRFLIDNSGATGTLSLLGPAGLSNGLIAGGSTWYFQGWYRDPSGPCAKHVNMTNGLRVVFGP